MQNDVAKTKVEESISKAKILAYSFLRWFDSWAGLNSNAQAKRQGIDWFRVIPFIGMHLFCLCVIWVGWSPIAVSVALALYFIRMFAITGFYHRYFSHRSFKTSRFAQFLFGALGNSAAQRGPLWWAAHHRHHHRHSDQPEDVHSPHQHGFLWSHMLWITTHENFPTDQRAVKDLAKFPELVFLDRFNALVPFMLFCSLYLLGNLLAHSMPELHTNGAQMIVWGFFVSTVVLFHGTCLINSAAHLMGRRRFETKDQSRNSWILAFITLGEGWHNNHHYYQGSTRQGFYWWEVDITYYVLRFLEKLGIIWDLRPVPEKVLELGRNLGALNK